MPSKAKKTADYLRNLTYQQLLSYLDEIGKTIVPKGDMREGRAHAELIMEISAEIAYREETKATETLEYATLRIGGTELQVMVKA